MKIKLKLSAIIFLGSTSLLFGQSKLEMIGAYNHSVFMYSYTLTLSDSENYEIEESSDLGSAKTIGTWTMYGRAIWLTPKKKITTDVHNNKKELEITNPIVEAVEVVTKDLLGLTTKDFKLVREEGG